MLLDERVDMAKTPTYYIEHCVAVLSNVHEHRYSELVRILVANGNVAKLAATNEEEEENDFGVEEQDQAWGAEGGEAATTTVRESYVEILTRYVSHCYDNLADDKPAYISTSYEIIRILSSLSVVSTPLCYQVLISNDKFLPCCASQVVRLSKLVVDAREESRRRAAVASIEYMWLLQREMRTIYKGRKSLLDSRRAEIDRIRAQRQEAWRLYKEEQDRIDALRTDAEREAIRKKEEEEEAKRKKIEAAQARQSRRDDPNFYKTELNRLYKEHNPEKLKNIPVLLETFKGREEVLLEKVYAKYNISMPQEEDEDEGPEDNPFSDVDRSRSPAAPSRTVRR